MSAVPIIFSSALTLVTFVLVLELAHFNSHGISFSLLLSKGLVDATDMTL